MQIDLRRHQWVVYREDVPVAFFSNARLAYETAYLRWKWNPEQKGDGALLLRGKAIPHSVMTPEGKYVHARDIAMNSWSFDRVLKFSSEPWKQIAPPEMAHWAIIKTA
jgi:hypothetical protein